MKLGYFNSLPDSAVSRLIGSGKLVLDEKELLRLDEHQLFKVFGRVMQIDGDGGFNEYQYPVIRALLKGKDCFCVMPTGGGKSFCFQFPALIREGVTVVIEPIIALMNDQIGHLADIGARAVRMTTVSEYELGILNSGAKLIYVSPETFLSPRFIMLAQTLDISMLVIDEAHCISLWGNGFRPAFLRLSRAFRQLGRRPQTAAFTATATEFVRGQVMTALSMKKGVAFELDTSSDPGRPFRRDNIHFEVKSIPADICRRNRERLLGCGEGFDEKQLMKAQPALRRLRMAYCILAGGKPIPAAFSTGSEEYDRLLSKWRTRDYPRRQALFEYQKKRGKLIEEISRELSAVKNAEKYPVLLEDILSVGESGAVIVYCNTVIGTDQLHKRLSGERSLKAAGFCACKYHGRMTSPERSSEQKRFSEDPRSRLMIATKAFGMGVDKDNVRLVIHFEVPRCPEDYFQEAGRAGRDRKPARAILYRYEPDLADTELAILHGGKLPSALQENAAQRASAEQKLTPAERAALRELDNWKRSVSRKYSYRKNKQSPDLGEAVRFFDLTDRKLLQMLDLHRFEKMREYTSLAGQSSGVLGGFIENYLAGDRPELTDEQIKETNDRVKLEAKRCTGLTLCTCKAAFDIRGGFCEPDVPHISYEGDRPVSTLLLSDRIDFFDLMLANAVFTLGFNGITSISAKKLFTVLTGDEGAAPEPAARDEIISRLCRLMNIRIKLTAPGGSVTEGRFLELERTTDRIFTYKAAPPLCAFSQKQGRRFITVPLTQLKTGIGAEAADGSRRFIKTVRDNRVNMLLKLAIAWRIQMLRRDPTGSKSYNQKVIRFTHTDKRRRGLLDLIGITPDDKPGLIMTVTHILNHCVREGLIADYTLSEDGAVIKTFVREDD